MNLVTDTINALTVGQHKPNRGIVVATITHALASDSREQAEMLAEGADARTAVTILKSINFAWPRIEESYGLILNA